MVPEKIIFCPLYGQPCFHPKVFHVTEVQDNKSKQEHHLCNGCRSFYQELEDDGYVPVLITPKYKTETKQTPTHVKSSEELLKIFEKEIEEEPFCPTCGLTPTEFEKTGKFGCADCYIFYDTEIPEVIEKSQAGALDHVGKKPKSMKNPALKKLYEEVFDAINKGDYDKATELKIQIREIKSKGTNDEAE